MKLTEARSVKQDNGLKRVEWIDVFKGLAIILMVTGHATGLYNAYIYQFHMAAFLFIAGFTSRQNNKSLGKIFTSKVRTLLFPFFTCFVMFAAGFWILNKIGGWNYLFAESFIYVGIRHTFIEFFTKGDNYLCFMGACGFILALFGSCLISKLLGMICSNKRLYIAASLAVLVLGYTLVGSGHDLRFYFLNLNIIFITQSGCL